MKAFKQFEASARITLSTVFGSESVFDTLAGLKDNASIIKALPGLSKQLSLSQTKQALEILKTKDAREAEIFILNQVIDKNDQAGFRIDLQLKDLRLASEAAFESGVPLPGLSLVQTLYLESRAHNEGKNGNQSLFKTYDRMTNQK